MNRFTLSLFALAVGGVLSAHADDVTGTYIANPSFELSAAGTSLTEAQKASNASLSVYGWTLAGIPTSYSNTEVDNQSTANSSVFGTNVTPADGSYYFFYRQGWASNSTNTVTLTATALSQLSAGTYTLSVKYKMATQTNYTDNASKGTDKDNGTTIQISALNGSTTLAASTASVVNKDLDGSATAFLGDSYEWQTLTATFTLTEAATPDFVITLTPRGQRRCDFVIDNVTLTTGYADGADLTSLITNPSFETGTNLSTDISGWTQEEPKFQLQNNESLAGKDGKLYAERWHVSGNFDLNQSISNLPAGIYKLTALAYADANTTSATLYANDEETAVTIGGAAAGYSVYVQLTEAGSLKIGYKTVSTASSWFAVDNFRLTYVSSSWPTVTAVTDDHMNTATAEAQTTAINTYNTTQNNTNYQAALKAIAAAQASVDGYANAAKVLAERKTQLDGLTTNFYTKAAYDTYYPINAYNNGTLDDATAAALQSTSVTGWHAATQLNQFLGAAWGVTSYDNVPYVNTWSTEDNDNGFATPFYEYWTGDANTLGDRTLTGTISGLTANTAYDVTADVRVSISTSSSAPATGITMQVGNAAEVKITGTQIGSTTRYKDSYTATGVTDADGNLTLKFNVASTNVSWLSFKNVKYVESTTADVDKLKAQEAVNDAIDAAEENNASLNDATLTAAIAAAQGVIDNSSSTTETLNSAATTLAAALSTAMTKDGADLTYKITNPSFEVNAANQSTDINGWTQSGTQKFELQDNKALNGLDGNYYAQRWHDNSDFDLNQSISLPAGYYHLTVRATAGAATSATLYAGSRAKAIATDGTTADYAVSFQVTEANSDVKIGFKAAGTANCWIAFDNFKLTAGVVAETSAMNATVKTTQDNAVSAYQKTKSLDNYDAAVQAVLAAKVSEANYAAAKTYLDAASSLDAAGKASYAADETVAAVQNAYNEGSLEAVTSEQITAMNTALVAAAKAQTTDGADMTLAITNPTINGSDGWTDYRPNGGNGPLLNNSSFEYWAGNAKDADNKDNKAYGKFDYYQVITGLPIGQYTVSADMYNSLNGESGATFSATSGLYAKTATAEDSVRVSEDGTTLTTYTTGKVTVTDGTLRIGVKNFETMTARWFVADNFKLTYHTYAPTATVTKAKFATYVTETAVDFSKTEGLQAYTAKYDATAKKITLTEVTKAPANTALVLYAADITADTEFTLSPVASADAVTDNGLTYYTEDTATKGNEWALTTIGSGVGFAPVASGVTIPAKKAFLVIESSSTSAKFLPIGEGVATGISSVKGQGGAADAPAYSLSGQRVGKSYKGVVIVNGKKVIRK